MSTSVLPGTLAVWDCGIYVGFYPVIVIEIHQARDDIAGVLETDTKLQWISLPLADVKSAHASWAPGDK